jgi:hypothetical protein
MFAMRSQPHPAKAVLVMRGITNKSIASLYGCSNVFVGRVLNGHDKAPPRFKAFLSDLLEVPEGELFFDRDAELVS